VAELRRSHTPFATAWRGPLLDAVARARLRHPGVKLKQGGSWSSPKILQTYAGFSDLIRWIWTLEEPAYKSLAELGLSKPWSGGSDLIMWANILERGDSIAIHHHGKRPGGDSLRGGVYGLSLPAGGGRLWTTESVDGAHDFVDPTPNEGEAILFSAKCLHGVSTHTADAPRITIAWSSR